MTEYRITLVKDHILIGEYGSFILIDTGSPLSFHSTGKIQLCGDTISVPTSILNTDSDYLSSHIGERVCGLIGMDLIQRYGALIDVPSGKVVFGQSSEGMERVPSQILMNYLIIHMDILGEDYKVVLDTGAPVSYVNPSITEGLTPVDRVVDFNPMVPEDTFETPIFEFAAAFAGEEFMMRGGHLPGLFNLTLNLIGVKGVVGMEIFRRHALLINEEGVWI
ncbi:MAG: hypothetical protein IJ584_16310 [Bacteroidales bacterium]|nr:hypothetical protein [Bacteroidales bacterium]MBR1436664.1 hypothetical protein [Bacteroidales bacterium]